MVRRPSSLEGRLGAFATLTVLLVGAAACGSSGNAGSGGSSGGTAPNGQETFTVGLLTDLTGPAASGNKTSVAGVKAGVTYAARNGYKIKYVVADTQTNPTAVQTAAKKLVTQDRVQAVVSVSALAQLAAPYLTARGIPVVGADIDGPEWQTAKNMFAVFGVLNSTKVATTFGKWMKSQGVTNVGTIGYGISPVSAEHAKGDAASTEAAGLKVGYLNANFPFGSTNVAPVAIAMKEGGVNGLSTATDPNTGLALITALRQQGVTLKASLLGTGYGSDLFDAGPGAQAAAQGVDFAVQAVPFSLQTPATQQFAADLKDTGTTTTQATSAEYSSYMSVILLVQALKSAGSDPSNASIISALSNIHAWNAAGLLGDQKIDVNDRSSYVVGPNNCAWVIKFQGKAFVPVAGADPVCGEVVPGKTVSSSS